MTQFRIAEPHSQRMATQLQHNISGDTASVLQKILESLGRIESRLSAVESALAEKMPERAEIQAQGQLLRECKVLSSKTHRSVSRITGEGVSEEQMLLQSLLPMSSEETLLKVEEHLIRQVYSDAMY
ncbi:uncharacterized protein LOC126765999 [Bactrocera neohumeralis]|uniref:uncharacterized protein LOC126765999 n=1 Tax=Bactrocera neohumeralis TaxID=98809 RepID=UPI002165FFD1|nr:uncharacterized protein LOC126765999 [Bactrocera neohumeralis]